MSKTKETAEAAAPEASKKAAKAKEPEKVLIKSRQLADKLGIKPTSLRRYLRTLPRFQDKNYTRYAWDPEDKVDAQFLTDIEASYKKFQDAEKKKTADRAEALKKKADDKEKIVQKSPAAKAGKKKPAPVVEAEPEEDEDEDSEEEFEELE